MDFYELDYDVMACGSFGEKKTIYKPVRKTNMNLVSPIRGERIKTKKGTKK